MAETTLCGRVGCGEPATCVLLMAAQDRQAWLVDLDHEFAPDGVSLCLAHADRITVPLGWSISDERPPAKPKRSRKKRAKPNTADADAKVEPGPEADADAKVEPGAEADADAKVEPGAEADADAKVEPRAEAAADAKVEPAAKAAADAKVEPAAKAESASKPARPSGDGVVGDDSTEPASDGSDGLESTDPAGPGAVGPDLRADSDDDHPTVQLPAVRPDHPSSPAAVPVNADAAAAGVEDGTRRLSVVPGEDDPNKTFDFEDDGQGALWASDNEAMHEPDERTPLLKRAFRVVRDD